MEPPLACPAWLPAVMEHALCEVMVFDAGTLALLCLNEAARRNLRRDPVPDDVSSTETFEDVLQIAAPVDLLRKSLRRGQRLAIEGTVRRRDGSEYPAELRLLLDESGPSPVLIAFGIDSSNRQEAALSLDATEERFRAMLSNTPGLAYQFLQRPDGRIAFPYLSEGCRSLLGIESDRLKANPSIFEARILEDDRPSYLASMVVSAQEMKSWNWEGRLWIAGWNDVKWVNLRATPRPFEAGGVLWEGIMTNITQSKQTEAELKASRAQLAELTAHVNRVKEEERTRIAREIHDDLGGNLTAIKMALALLVRRVPADAPAAVEKAAYLEQLLDRTIESVHRIAGDLRPGILDFGLLAAIEWQASEFEKQLGIPCAVRHDVARHGGEPELDAEQSTALFRVFQEAVTNIGKHAQATRVEVRLAADADHLIMEIVDDGRGIAPEDRFKPQSFGIRGMEERAAALGGVLQVRNGADRGCVATIRIPLPAGRAGASASQHSPSSVDHPT
ncbi:MAG: PAS domain-containing sensor histidine kinase [Burkholderiaceae bacterium]